MAVPVGVYTLRQIEAADGYALCETDEITVDIPPYLTQGGTAAEVNLTCLSLPETEEIDRVDCRRVRGQRTGTDAADGGDERGAQRRNVDSAARANRRGGTERARG